MAEVKAPLRLVEGLALCDQDDLLRSESYGLQAYVKKSLNAANNTLIKLSLERVPLALVGGGRLMPRHGGDQQFDIDPVESRQAIKARRVEQRKFPKAYATRTATMATTAPTYTNTLTTTPTKDSGEDRENERSAFCVSAGSVVEVSCDR